MWPAYEPKPQPLQPTPHRQGPPLFREDYEPPPQKQGEIDMWVKAEEVWQLFPPDVPVAMQRILRFWVCKRDYGSMRETQRRRLGITTTDDVRMAPPSPAGIMSTEDYAFWKTYRGQVMLCLGQPGVGKSVLAAKVWEDVSLPKPDEDKVWTHEASAVVFCDKGAYHDQGVDEILASIASQFAVAMFRHGVLEWDVIEPSVFRNYYYCVDLIRKEYKHSHKDMAAVIGTEVQWLLDYQLSFLTGKAYIIVDGLDHLDVQVRNDLLNALFFLRNKRNVNLWLSGTPTKSLVEPFKKRTYDGSTSFFYCELKGGDDDEVASAVLRDTAFADAVRGHDKLLGEIGQTIGGIARGNFLLAHLLAIPLTKTSAAGQNPATVREYLGMISTKMSQKPLDAALKHALTQAARTLALQPGRDGMLGYRALMWTTCGHRQIRIEELRYAVAMETDAQGVGSLAPVPAEADLIGATLGLLDVVDRDRGGIVVFKHDLVGAYFRRNRALLFPDADVHIASACAAYLGLQAFADPFPDKSRPAPNNSQPVPEAMPLHWDFYVWALDGWTSHLRLAGLLPRPGAGKDVSSIPRGVMHLLSQEKQCTILYLAIHRPAVVLRRGLEVYTDPVQFPVTGFHLAAYVGLEPVVEHLLDTGAFKPNQLTRNRFSAWWFARKGGHDDMVRLLIKKGAVWDPSRELGWPKEEEKNKDKDKNKNKNKNKNKKRKRPQQEE